MGKETITPAPKSIFLSAPRRPSSCGPFERVIRYSPGNCDRKRRMLATGLTKIKRPYRRRDLMGTLGGHLGKLSTCRRSAAPCLTWPGEVVTIRVVVNISGPDNRFAELSVDSMPN